MKCLNKILISAVILIISSTSFLYAQAETFTAFDVQPCTGNSVVIQWTINPVADSLFYEVERSTDKSNWEKIAHVKAQASHQYFSIDSDPKDGIIYYRVRKAGEKGSYSYSEIKWVQISKEKELYVWPGSSKDMLHVRTPFIKCSVDIIDAGGKLLIRAEINNYTTELSTSCLANGEYVLQVRQDNETVVEKFVKG